MEENPVQMFSVSELIKNVPELEGLSTQKVSPLMAKLVDELKVVKVVEKRKSYFQIAG